MKSFMKLFTLFIVVFALAGCASRPASGFSEGDTSPWQEIVEEARWAQNAHNVQSWKLEVLNDRELTGGLDPERLLPETDPIGRQLVLSQGALSAAAEQTARELGYSLEATWIGGDWTLEQGAEARLFKWTIIPTGPEPSPIIDGLSSATVKYRMPPATLVADYSDRLQSAYDGEGHRFIIESGGERVAESIELAIASFEVEMRFEPTARESYDLTRIGRGARRKNPYGITLRGNFPSSVFWLVDGMAALFPQDLDQYADTSIELFTSAVENAETLVVLTTRSNDPASWFEAGKSLQLLWMDLRTQGYELLPLSQGLQEYPEVAAYYERFHELWADDGESVQMIMSVGRPSSRFGRSPRLPVEAIMDYSSTSEGP
jgi:nitroreductase